MSIDDKFIGKGLVFPLELDNTGAVEVTEKLDLIKQSIITSLEWPIGTRFFLGEFGSKLDQLLEEPNDMILSALIKDYVIDAVNRWEKRITILESTILSRDENKVDIRLTYEVIKLKIKDSFIYPFYTNLIY